MKPALTGPQTATCSCIVPLRMHRLRIYSVAKQVQVITHVVDLSCLLIGEDDETCTACRPKLD